MIRDAENYDDKRWFIEYRSQLAGYKYFSIVSGSENVNQKLKTLKRIKLNCGIFEVSERGDPRN